MKIIKIGILLGTYETEERAREVVEEIFTAYGVEQIYAHTRNYSAQQMILKETEKYPELCKTIGLYQMPEK